MAMIRSISMLMAFALATCVARGEFVVLTRVDEHGAIDAGAVRVVDFSGRKSGWRDDAREYLEAGHAMPAKFPALADTERDVSVPITNGMAEAFAQLEAVAVRRDASASEASSNLTAAVVAVGASDARDAMRRARDRVRQAQTVAQLRAAVLDALALLSAQTDVAAADVQSVRSTNKHNRPTR